MKVDNSIIFPSNSNPLKQQQHNKRHSFSETYLKCRLACPLVKIDSLRGITNSTPNHQLSEAEEYMEQRFPSDPASPDDSEDSKGIFPAKLTAKTSLRDSFSELPGVYNFDIALKRTAGGRAGVELKGAKYVKPISLTAGSKHPSPKPH